MLVFCSHFLSRSRWASPGRRLPQGFVVARSPTLRSTAVAPGVTGPSRRPTGTTRSPSRSGPATGRPGLDDIDNHLADLQRFAAKKARKRDQRQCPLKNVRLLSGLMAKGETAPDRSGPEIIDVDHDQCNNRLQQTVLR
ncbi:hypothetical protein ACFQGL_11745 [Micromonospora vulcania]|uniref:Uncharacterized protein n=1 Tax=Micromonospora vulcania TaxID=1441873 RepID=A0ABW1H314_9ACTN